MKSTNKCSICGSDIRNLRAKGILREVVGWAAPRSKGGINHLINQQATGRIAHNACAEGEKFMTKQLTIDDYLEDAYDND